MEQYIDDVVRTEMGVLEHNLLLAALHNYTISDILVMLPQGPKDVVR